MGTTVVTKESAAPAARPHRVAGEERRRSQRVLLRARARIYVNLKDKPETLEVSTLSVNPYGAMIVCAQNLTEHTRLVLEHGGTLERIACRVTRTAKEMPEGFHVPIEFDMPARNFWKIDFPPEDWKPCDDL